MPPGERLQLQIEGEHRGNLTLLVSDRVLVGRADEDDENSPGLDLAPYGGANKGVSRIHAAFGYEDGGVYVEDLNSTNGTRINGLALSPNQHYRLRDGDELEFGSARVIVRFSRSAF